MKYILVPFLMISFSFLFAGEIKFSENVYATKDFIRGVEIKKPRTIILADSIFSYPECKLLNIDSLFKEYKFYLIILHSPYTCPDCYHSDVKLINYFAKKYPEQVYLLSEYWEVRDVKKSITKSGVDKNVKILLDKKGENIRRLSNLDDNFINAGFVIIDNNLKIHYVLMGSFAYPYSDKSMKKLATYINNYLKK